MINGEYKFSVRQTGVNNFLRTLRGSEFVMDDLKISAALANVFEFVLKN